MRATRDQRVIGFSPAPKGTYYRQGAPSGPSAFSSQPFRRGVFFGQPFAGRSAFLSLLATTCLFCLPEGYQAPTRNEIVPTHRSKPGPKPKPRTCYLLDNIGGRLLDGRGGYLTC